MGWEWYDIFAIFLKIIDTNTPNNWQLYFIMITHHLSAQVLAVPINLKYSDNWYVAAFIFSIQLTATLTLLISCLIETMNIEKDIKKILPMALFTWILMIFGRGFFFAYVCRGVLNKILEVDGIRMYYIGFVALSGVTIVNFGMIFMCTERIPRFIRYYRKS